MAAEADRHYRIEYTKDCRCKSESTVGATRLIYRDDGHGKAPVLIGSEFITGPSCDKCGKAWRRKEGWDDEIHDGRAR